MLRFLVPEPAQTWHQFLVVMVTFDTTPVGRSGQYFTRLFTYIGEQKYKVWARSAHGKFVKSDHNHQKLVPFFHTVFFTQFFQTDFRTLLGGGVGGGFLI